MTNYLEFSQLLLLFPLVITLHMIEEVIWLPAWSQSAGRWHEPVTTREFSLATAVFLLFIFTATYFARRAHAPGLSLYLLLGMAVVLLANIIWPHLGATLAQRRYAPGLLTALLFILPFMSYFVWRAFQVWPLSPLNFLLATLLMLLTAVFVWPLLFRLGKEQSPIRS